MSWPLPRLLLAACGTVAFGWAFVQRRFPLGVPGEFEIPRLGVWDTPITPLVLLLPAAVAAVVLVAFLMWAMGRVETESRRFFFFALAATMFAGASYQVLLEAVSPGGFEKWGALFHSFRYAARTEFQDVDSVLTKHAEMAASFEPNHISVNPVGWILVHRALLSFFDQHPAVAEAMFSIEPDEVKGSLRRRNGLRFIPFADRADMMTVAYASRCAALLVGLPIAWLVRQRYSRSAALAAVAFSMFVPAAILLAPMADTVYPTFAALIVALSYYASANRSWAAAALAGALIGVGMLFSLSYLVTAAICGLLVAVRALQGHRPPLAAVIAAPSAWLLVLLVLAGACGHRAWESWQVNLAKNYEFNRFSGCTYARWVPVNLAEFAVAMGLPAAIFLAVRIATGLRGLRPWRSADAVCAAWTIVLGLLAVAGANRGEVSRLWLFLMPMGAALAIETLNARDVRVRAVVAGALVLQAAIGLLLCRELVLMWQFMPHDMAQVFVEKNQRQWVDLRRLTDEEFERRTGQRPEYLDLATSDAEIRPAQVAYVWSAREEMVGAATSADAYTRLVQAATAHDKDALDELTAEGLVTLLPQNCEVVVVKTGKQTHIVRLLGHASGTTVYVGVDEVHRKKKP
ncbi:MAG TPA: hypothetical protein VHC22_00545 [Pirellulales bacterium]|nr:hypothetical protein [Pirellulales bacterium]